MIPLVPRVNSGWYLVVPLLIAGSGLGLLVSQLNNFTLAPIAEERVSEAAGVNSAAAPSVCRSGWPWQVACALGPAMSFTNLTYCEHRDPDGSAAPDRRRVETDAEVMSNTQLQHQIADQPKAVQDAVLAINTDARNRSLQVALLVPTLPVSLAWRRVPDAATPDIEPAAPIDGVDFG